MEGELKRAKLNSSNISNHGNQTKEFRILWVLE